MASCCARPKTSTPTCFRTLRGGGGQLRVRLHLGFELPAPFVGPTLLAGPILWDAADARKSFASIATSSRRRSRRKLGTVVRFGAAPPLSVIPDDLRHLRARVVMVVYVLAGHGYRGR